MLQCVAVCCKSLKNIREQAINRGETEKTYSCVAVCGSVLQCVAACCSVWQRVAVCGSVLQSSEGATETFSSRGRVLQCAAVCCSVLQCVVVCCSVSQ